MNELRQLLHIPIVPIVEGDELTQIRRRKTSGPKPNMQLPSLTPGRHDRRDGMEP
jgi:hypothetical protein